MASSESFKGQLSPTGLVVLEQLGDRVAEIVSSRFGGKIDLSALTRVVAAAMPFLTAEEARAMTIGSLAASQKTENAQMLKLQIAMQRENQLFTSISNVLKTRHDTVKNSIGNVR